MHVCHFFANSFVVGPRTQPLPRVRRLFVMLTRHYLFWNMQQQICSKRHFGWAEFRHVQATKNKYNLNQCLNKFEHTLDGYVNVNIFRGWKRVNPCPSCRCRLLGQVSRCHGVTNISRFWHPNDLTNFRFKALTLWPRNFKWNHRMVRIDQHKSFRCHESLCASTSFWWCRPLSL